MTLAWPLILIKYSLILIILEENTPETILRINLIIQFLFCFVKLFSGEWTTYFYSWPTVTVFTCDCFCYCPSLYGKIVRQVYWDVHDSLQLLARQKFTFKSFKPFNWSPQMMVSLREGSIFILYFRESILKVEHNLKVKNVSFVSTFWSTKNKLNLIAQKCF